jgi:hypothetical protein
MTRTYFVAAGAVLALAAATPANAQTSGKGGSGGGGQRSTAPSRSTLPSSALTASSVASPFAWIDDGRILPPATFTVAVSTLHWQGTDLSEVDAPVTSIAAGVAPRVQVGASIPHIVGGSEPTGAAGGLGSTYFYGKVGLLGGESPIKLAVAPTIEVLGDGAAQSLATTESRMQFGLPVSLEFDAGSTRVFAGTGFFTRGIRFAGGGVAAQAAPRVGISVSFSHSWTTADVVGVVADRTELTGSAAFTIASNVSVFGSIGQTIATTDQNGAGTTVSGGVSVLLRPSLFRSSP